MKYSKIFLATFLALIGVCTVLYAVSDPMVFPKNGQSKEQQMMDKRDCQDWAKNETGINPDYTLAKIDSLNENMANQAAGKSSSMGGKIVRGAAMGAAMGGIDEGIDSKAGAGAAKGALFMAAKGRQDKQKAQQQAAVDSQYAQREQLEKQYDTYIRAFSACLDAKGYSVK